MEPKARATQLRDHVTNLNRLILDGQIMEAFERYYADNVVMLENLEEPTVGKDANRAREREWLENVTEFRHAEVRSVGVDSDQDTTFVEWIMDYHHREWGDVRNHQVSVQRWKGDQIVHERFVYG